MSAVPALAPVPPTAGARLRACDVMTRRVVTVAPETPVKQVASLMLAYRVSGLPVVTENGEVVGIVSETDLLHKERGPAPGDGRVRRALRALLAAGRDRRKADGLTAADLMTAPAVTVEEDTPLHAIAALMVRRGINRVPVMRGGRLAGIVSRGDVVRALTRTDADVARAVRTSLLRDLWVDVTRITVTVRDGIATLDGQVDRRSERDLVVRWVAGIDGVVGVDSRLRYEYDDRRVHLGERWPAPRA